MILNIRGFLQQAAKKHPTKYVFVSGGVLSGLGKGVTAASLGVVLKAHGYSVSNIKCENYLNLDSGNINPTEHGDVFLCDDGLEADLDLGSYERFLNEEVGYKNFVTVGQVYSTVIENAKNLKYAGITVDAIPFIPEEVIRRIQAAGKGYDICLVELGGTVGEYQNIVYYEAYRIMKMTLPDDVIIVHVTYFPTPKHLKELKSKPTQLSVKTLNSMSIQPDFIVGRGTTYIDEKRKEKVAYFSNMEKEEIISNPDCKSIYEIPLVFQKQQFGKKVLKKLKLADKKIQLKDWQTMVKKIYSKKNKKVTIAIIVKYIKSGEYELKDSYASLLEAIDHAAWQQELTVKIVFINAEKLEKKHKQTINDLQKANGIIVPIGWGTRGVEGKIVAIQYAREKKIPYLGLCYGMQLAAIEFARNVLNLKDAHTVEVNPKTKNPIIHAIPRNTKYQKRKNNEISMRLGAYDCVLKKDTLAYQIYKKHDAFKNEKHGLISERHRHQFEFNNQYRQALEKKGLIVSGTSPNDSFVEMIELAKTNHPFFLATQAHPEYKSRPLSPHPIFIEYLKAVLEQSKKNK